MNELESRYKMALECLYVAKKNDEWSILYPHFKTLEAALTAKPCIVNLSEEEATAPGKGDPNEQKTD